MPSDWPVLEVWDCPSQTVQCIRTAGPKSLLTSDLQFGTRRQNHPAFTGYKLLKQVFFQYSVDPAGGFQSLYGHILVGSQNDIQLSCHLCVCVFVSKLGAPKTALPLKQPHKWFPW